jgi:hypothetical protein
MERISKIAKLFGYASIAFAIILAIITLLLIQSASLSGAPIDYQILYTLQNIWPYLFVATLSLLIGYKLPSEEETEETDEEMPPEQTQLP